MSKYQLGETVGIRIEDKYFEGEITLIRERDGGLVYTVTVTTENVDGEQVNLHCERAEHDMVPRHKSDYERAFHDEQ
jgi:hypothetical protein